MNIVILPAVAAVCFYLAFKITPLAWVVLIPFWWIWAHESEKAQKIEIKAEEPQLPEKHETVIDEDEFPTPYFEDPPMIPDSHTCMNNVMAYEELAQRARDCGREELAEQYEEIAARWRYLFEEAEDEEMEW